MHPLNGVEVSSGDEDEVAGNRFGLGQRTRRALRATGDGEGTVLHCRQKRLLFLEAQQVDLVNVEDPLVSAMDGARFNSVVGGCFHPTGLERVVAHVAEQGAGKRGCCVNEGGEFVQVVLDQNLGNSTVVDRTQSTSDEHVPEHQQETSEQEREQVAGLEGSDEEKESDGCKRDEQHALRFFPLLPNGFFLDFDNALGSASRHGSDAWNVFVVLVGVNENVFECVLGQQVGHGASEHGLARPRVADHEHVSALLSGFFDDNRTRFLSDHLVDQSLRNGNIGG